MYRPPSVDMIRCTSPAAILSLIGVPAAPSQAAQQRLQHLHDRRCRHRPHANQRDFVEHNRVILRCATRHVLGRICQVQRIRLRHVPILSAADSHTALGSLTYIG